RNGNGHHPAGPSALGFPIPHRPEGTRFRTPHSPAALAHRRLSIIDLSEAGRQPLSHQGRSGWISYNGEIYKFQELRAELEGLGHRFQTRTDTEVVVHAWEQWGVDCVQRLRGMFAFALWDENARRLFLARDRLGKKPLYYARQGDRFLFASEVQ